jgi:hypothetical protein
MYKTTIIEVVRQSGDRATAKPIHPNATLFEVTHGPHAGKRGADYDLRTLVGPVVWDHSRVSVYETREILTWAAFEDQARGVTTKR